MTTNLHRTVAAAKAALIGTVAVVAAGATPTAAHAETAEPTAGGVTVTNISQSAFRNADTATAGCREVGSVTMCQDVEGGGSTGNVTWSVYADLGTDGDSATVVKALMNAASEPLTHDASAEQSATVTSRWIKVTWGSGIQDAGTLGLDTTLTLDGTAYEYDCRTMQDFTFKTYDSSCSISSSAAQTV